MAAMTYINTDCSRMFLLNKGIRREDHIYGLVELHDMYEALAAVQNQWSITTDDPTTNGGWKWATVCLCFVDQQMDRHSTRQGNVQKFNTNMWLAHLDRGDSTPPYPTNATDAEKAECDDNVLKAKICRELCGELQ